MLHSSRLPFIETGSFSALFNDYIQQVPRLKPFYHKDHLPENYASLFDQFDAVDREKLVTILNKQYKDITPLAPKVSKHIALLGEKTTFTVCTGHQLNLLTGPLYFIYKIITTIKLAQDLKKHYPNYNFVPVYWMATEDHDVDEISVFNLFGKSYRWETDQKGPVGKLKVDTALRELITSLPEKISLAEDAYTEGRSLSDATRILVNALFGDYGLVVLDADEPELKITFKDILKKELQAPIVYNTCNNTSEELKSAGYKTQINPREINLFLFKNGDRYRIEKNKDTSFTLIETGEIISERDLLELADTNPELFSPNVILRPVYQQLILPNLSYIGGPAEIAYWLQLKASFDTLKVPFPILTARHCALMIPANQAKKIAKLGLTNEQLFLDSELLKKNYLKQQDADLLVLENERSLLDHLYQSINEKVVRIDASLSGFVGAEHKKATDQLHNIEKRLLKAAETKSESVLQQIENIKAKLFPNGGLQERYDNYFTYALNRPHLLDELMEVFISFENTFLILQDE